MHKDLILLPDGTAKPIDQADRSELLAGLMEHQKKYDEWLRRQVINNNRIDMLSNEILGRQLQPFHLKMLQFQFKHPESLQLAYRGAGKCLALGTQVLMFDGSTKAVEDILVGDRVMGPDSCPRNVLSLGRGRSPMYRVVPIKGDPWVCNEEHILTLKGRGHFYGDKIRDFPIKDVIAMGKRNKRGTTDIPWKQFRVGVSFEEQDVDIDPYLVGLWLGDGTEGAPNITSEDHEIWSWSERWASGNGYRCNIYDPLNRAAQICFTTSDVHTKNANPLRQFFLRIGKRIPRNYLINSEKIRLRLLAGLVDSDGHVDQKKCHLEITQKREDLLDDVIFLARSLGFAAYKTKIRKSIKSTGFVGTYYRANITGHLDRIPCILPRKQCRARQSPKDVLVTGFTIEQLPEDDYYGFTLDGDGRFLLGDFTVTHNTSSCTITKAIHYLIKNRDMRILLVSKTKGTAESILKEIKGHLESNERLIELFGEFYDPYKVAKWDNSEIEVVGRTKVIREASITCVGVDSAVVSRHYDVILIDDLIDEENARTKHLRDKTRTWYYTTLMPTLEPPDSQVEHRGEQHFLGTRYHYDDLYGHLQLNELREHYQIIPALDDQGRSPWPEKYPPSFFHKKKARSGLIIFNCQYLCNADAMKGEVFRYDDCQQIPRKAFPKLEDLKIFAGVDLAISQKETADQFAIVVIGIHGDPYSADYQIYVLDFFAGQVRFSEQTTKIVEMSEKWDPILTLVEANAYQLAQVQELQRLHPALRVQPHVTDKDKMTRAWKLSPIFEQKRVFFEGDIDRGTPQGPIIDQLVLFPNHRYKDLFDALDLAVAACKIRKRRRKRRRAEEPGLIGGRRKL